MQAAETKQQQIISTEFSKKSLEQTKVASKIKPSSYLPHRLDLRGKTILTFAMSNGKSSECGLSLQKTQTGWELGIHVADVDEYVCDGSPIDSEAKKRCATISDGFTKSEMLHFLTTALFYANTQVRAARVEQTMHRQNILAGCAVSWPKKMLSGKPASLEK